MEMKEGLDFSVATGFTFYFCGFCAYFIDTFGLGVWGRRKDLDSSSYRILTGSVFPKMAQSAVCNAHFARPKVSNEVTTRIFTCIDREHISVPNILL